MSMTECQTRLYKFANFAPSNFALYKFIYIYIRIMFIHFQALSIHLYRESDVNINPPKGADQWESQESEARPVLEIRLGLQGAAPPKWENMV